MVSYNTAIPVRFNEVTTARLKKVSENTTLSVAQLIRLATEKYLDEIESSRAVTVKFADHSPAYSTKRPKP